MAKKRFTWLDAVLIGAIVLALAVAAVWYFYGKNRTAPAEEAAYDVTLRFTSATNDAFDYYKIGDLLYTQDREALLGTITGLKKVPFTYEEYDRVKGCYVQITDPKRTTVEMTLRVRGRMAEGSFTVNGEDIQIGRTFYPQSDTTRSIMTVWAIKEVAA